MTRLRTWIWCLALLVLLPATNGLAVSNLISYQGLLLSESGVPVNGTVSFEFKIYSSPSGGSALWTESQSLVVSNGIFSANLGSVASLPPAVFTQNILFLGIRAGSDGEMTPRQVITSSPFSYRVPIGGIVAWHKSMPGVPSLAEGWAECNGQVLADAESPLNGQALPNLNGQALLLSGAVASGLVRTEDYLPAHTHGSGSLQFKTAGTYNIAQGFSGNSQCTGDVCGGETGATQSGTPFSSFGVVWIIRVR